MVRDKKELEKYKWKCAEMNINTTVSARFISAICLLSLKTAASVQDTETLLKDTCCFDNPGAESLKYKQCDGANCTTVKSRTDPDKEFNTQASLPLSLSPSGCARACASVCLSVWGCVPSLQNSVDSPSGIKSTMGPFCTSVHCPTKLRNYGILQN